MTAHQHTTSALVEYRTIARFEGYRFGDDGSIWTCRRLVQVQWRELARNVDSNGYLSVYLRCVDPWSFKRYRMHALILEAFVGPKPPKHECRHIDGTRTNNRLDNLQWATRRENHADKRRHGTSHQGDRAPAAKLTWEKVAEIRRLRAEGLTHVALARLFGVHHTNICFIVNNKTWIEPPT